MTHRRLPHALVLGLVLAGAAGAAGAGTVWRWTDDAGRTHYGETVPERYRDRARPLAADPAPPSDEQRREARERAARDKARAAAIADAPPAAAPAPPPAASTAEGPRRPARAPDADTDCATWARLYQESLDCFGPYRTVRGATRPEAFERCTPVDEPPSRCRR